MRQFQPPEVGRDGLHLAANLEHFIATDAIQITLLAAGFETSVVDLDGLKAIASDLDNLSRFQKLDFFVKSLLFHILYQATSRKSGSQKIEHDGTIGGRLHSPSSSKKQPLMQEWPISRSSSAIRLNTSGKFLRIAHQ